MTRPKVSFETPRHTPLLDRDEHLLGCIDQLDNDAELIRLDGGIHWIAFNSLD